MIITFNTWFDGDAWPGPLECRKAVVGEIWTGPSGLVGILQTQLGLHIPLESSSIRAAALMPAIRIMKGFWSESAAVDPFAVAKILLHWRDTLILAGLDKKPSSKRLAELLAVTQNVLPGLPDVMDTVLRALETQDVDIDSICLIGEDLTDLPKKWQQVLEKLQIKGTKVEYKPVIPISSSSNLARCLRAQFSPLSNDDSLQLIRPSGPLTAAEQVAAWLADQDRWKGTVIIGGDAVLDTALNRHGLPTIGAHGVNQENALLQILPLILEMAWMPQNPNIAMELCLLPEGPIPGKIAWRLVDALEQWPAIDSKEWKDALWKGLDEEKDQKRREKIEKRLTTFFAGIIKGNDYPVDELQKRIQELIGWFQANRVHKTQNLEHWDIAIAQCMGFRRLVESAKLTTLSRYLLHKFIQEATANLGTTSRFTARAGISGLEYPGAMVGLAERVVWWNFNSSSAEQVKDFPFDKEDLNELETLGVTIPTPANRVKVLNRLWQRPFEQTSKNLLLVCPQIDESGNEQYPHPIWDEIVAHLSDETLISELVRSEPFGLTKTKTHQLLASPIRQAIWNIQGEHASTIKQPEKMSPTNAGALLECPFSWILQHVGKIEAGQSCRLEEGGLLHGKIIHEILERLLQCCMEQSKTFLPEEAEKEALALFEKEVPFLAGVYFKPGEEKNRAEFRRSCGIAAAELFRCIQQSKAKILGVEVPVEVQDEEIQLVGRVDILLDKPKRIIDIKWKNPSKLRDEFTSGTAYQLAMYSRMLSDGLRMPPVAYFAATNQGIFTTSDDFFPGIPKISGPNPEETWKGFRNAYKARWQDIKAGKVLAAGIEDANHQPPDKSVLIDGQIELKPHCEYCEFGGLCGVKDE
jgi:hypothetical protein